MFTASQYFDQDTGKTRWAVLDTRARVYYFPSRYGRRAAVTMAERLNASAA